VLVWLCVGARLVVAVSGAAHDEGVKRCGWLASLLVVAVVACSTGDSAQPSASQRRPRASTDVAALTRDGRVVALDAKTGRQKRLLARGALTDQPGLTVDVEGAYVYFTRPMANPPCAGLGASGDVPELVRVALAGGPVETPTPPGVSPVTGFHPIISPSGQNIAFMGAPCGSGLLAQFHLPTPRTPAGPVWAGNAPDTIVTPLAWSSDSLRILFETIPRGESTPRLMVTGAVASGAQATGVWGPGGYTAATYRRDALVIAETNKRGFRVLQVMEPRPRQLFRGDGTNPTSMDFDASGRKLLYVADGSLFRWNQGDEKPKNLAAGVVAAVWVSKR
jgi:hypothetical protein